MRAYPIKDSEDISRGLVRGFLGLDCAVALDILESLVDCVGGRALSGATRSPSSASGKAIMTASPPCTRLSSTCNVSSSLELCPVRILTQWLGMADTVESSRVASPTLASGW